MQLISPASLLVPLQFEGQSRSEVFGLIFEVFLALGTLVGVVVISYTLYNAYRNRDGGEDTADDDRPVVGELPTGGGGGRKLFLSFAISAVIVVGLVVWTYSALLYVEGQPSDARQINVTGEDFTWQFEYENGVTTVNELRVPADERVLIKATSGDVWHTFGIPEKRVKTDAIPGQTSTTWFNTGEPGEYRAECFELCGTGHSGMQATVIVMEEDQFEQWLANQSEQAEQSANDDGGQNESGNSSGRLSHPSTGPSPAAASTASYGAGTPQGAALAGGDRR